METHHLYHLAACWSARHNILHSAPLTTSPVIGTYVPAQQALAAPGTVIRAAAAQMIFASRTSQDFISPEQVRETEKWTGKVGRSFLSSPCSCRACSFTCFALVFIILCEFINMLGRPGSADWNEACRQCTSSYRHRNSCADNLSYCLSVCTQKKGPFGSFPSSNEMARTW